MRQHLKIFKALGDRSRLRIMKMLEVKAMCVCEITDVLNLAPSTVSKHLSLLHEADLIEDRKEGKWVNYSLPGKGRIPLVTEMLKLIHFSLEEDSQIQADRKRAKMTDRVKICG
jgi:DNA-binding transcriptional ArsR family regulator